MTEIPEHLRRRAEWARERAAAQAEGREPNPALDPGAPWVPAHLLARAEAARRTAEPERKRFVGVYFVGRDPKEALGGYSYAEAGDAITRRDELNPGGLGFQPYKIFATDVEVKESDLFEW